LGSTALICGLACVMAVTALAAPEDRTPPEVSGNVELGGIVYCETGTWTGIGGAVGFTFTWISDGHPIAGEEKGVYPSYELTKADEGQEIWCIVTGHGEDQEVQAESANSVKFPPGPPKKEGPPELVEPPVVSGKGEVGARLECSQGVWTGYPEPTYSYSWWREGHEIVGQTGTSYTITSEDEGYSLNCRVAAKNRVAEVFAPSKEVYVPGTLPELVAPPKVEGIGDVGETLTCNHGQWTGSAGITFSYEWLLNGASISGGVGSTIVVEPSYEGEQVACRVTATNKVGKAIAESPGVTIPHEPPENLLRPAITGAKSEGSSLTCSHGEWSNAPKSNGYEYHWYRQLENSEEELPETSEHHTVVGEDVGHALFCVVRAENDGGKGTAARSKPFVIPSPGPGEAPQDTTLPLIASGGSGRALSCTQGEWTGTPTIKYEYQWVRDANTAQEVDIAGATRSGYAVQSADEGHTLTCEITATNSYGSVPADSEPLSIPGKAPVSTQAPSILGTPRENETLTCERGEWEGSKPIEYTYRWLRGGAETGVTGYTYTVHTADLGQSLTCVVTAKNSEGPGEAQSPELYVPGEPPGPLVPPTITGNPQVNEELTCEEGKWNGAPLTPSFEWLLDGTPISGATQKHFTVDTVDRGLDLICRVTETNKEGHASAYSAAVRIAGVRPKDVIEPSITGSASLGAMITCEHGLWEGAPPPSFSYQWYREGASIEKATEATYTIAPADQGHLLACVVTAENVQGYSQAESTNTVAVPAHKTEGNKEGAVIAESTGHPKPTITAVYDAFLSQLPHEIAEAKLKAVRKKSSYSLGFTAAGAGQFELEWYVNVKAAHNVCAG
jgi:hypothetical protein